jgi:drug/metabolite transporter (DMT)-like permease
LVFDDQGDGLSNSTLLFIAAMALSGTIGVFVTESHLSPLNAVLFRCVIAVVILGAYCAARGWLTSRIWRSRELRPVLLGGLALVANWALLFQSFRLSSITVGIVGYYTAPFFMILLGRVFLRERFAPSVLAWTVLAFAGLVLTATTGQASILNDERILLGVCCALAAAALYASLTIAGRSIRELEPALVAFLQMAIGVVALLPFANLAEAWNSNTQWGYVVFLGAVHTALLYLLFYAAVRGVPVALLAPLAFIDPVIAILSDVVIYAMRPSIGQVAGIVVILMSAYVVSRPRPEEAESRKE